MEKLQGSKVAAMPVLRAPEIFSDSHLRYRKFIQEVNHPQIGKRFVFGPPWHSSDDTTYIAVRGPLLGEHNDYVFCELLGLSPDEVLQLKEEKVLS
jgi:formyl-CoA transferase